MSEKEQTTADGLNSQYNPDRVIVTIDGVIFNDFLDGDEVIAQANKIFQTDKTNNNS